MSAGYAERLSEYHNKGKCGLPETHDSARALTSKLDSLAKLMRESSHTVVLTGAGCSTAAGIPDFRGPNGIWTREQRERNKKKGKKRKKLESNDEKQDRSVGTNWVQCDLCQKWRRILNSKTVELPDHWNCSMNASDDPHHSKCSDPEEDYNHGSRIQPGTTPIAESSKDAGKMEERVSLIQATSESSNNEPKEIKSNNSSSKPAIPSFASAIPTYTHRALTHLVLQPPPPKEHGDDSDSDDNTPTQRTYLNYIVTQNIDGLHRKSRLPRKYHSILHGDIFTEVCDTCHTEHVRPYEISSIGLSYTGRNCTLGGNPPGSCPGRLMDTLLDWENDMPDQDWKRAQEECEAAELIICLGTSLRIEPAGSLCLFAQDAGEAEKGRKKKKLGYVIVNLQVTPYDDDAALVIRGKVDDVMQGLMFRLGYSRDWDDLFDYGKTIKKDASC